MLHRPFKIIALTARRRLFCLPFLASMPATMLLRFFMFMVLYYTQQFFLTRAYWSSRRGGGIKCVEGWHGSVRTGPQEGRACHRPNPALPLQTPRSSRSPPRTRLAQGLGNLHCRPCPKSGHGALGQPRKERPQHQRSFQKKAFFLWPLPRTCSCQNWMARPTSPCTLFLKWVHFPASSKKNMLVFNVPHPSIFQINRKER